MLKHLHQALPKEVIDAVINYIATKPLQEVLGLHNAIVSNAEVNDTNAEPTAIKPLKPLKPAGK